MTLHYKAFTGLHKQIMTECMLHLHRQTGYDGIAEAETVTVCGTDAVGA